MVLIKSDSIAHRFLSQDEIYISSCFPWQTAYKPLDTNRGIPCARLLLSWLVVWWSHFTFHLKVSLPLTASIGIYLLLNLVFTSEHLWTDSLPTWWHLSDRIYRQRLQMPLSTWIQGHQLRGKKRSVKIHFSFGEILLWKTLPNPLSYLSMNPTVSLIKPATRPSAPPDVWIPFCPSCFPIHLPD